MGCVLGCLACGCSWSIGGGKKEASTSHEPTRGQELIDLKKAKDLGAINEEELGLPSADLDELIAKVRELPFEHAFLLIARIAAEVWHMREDAERQLDLVRSFEMPNLVAKLEEV